MLAPRLQQKIIWLRLRSTSISVALVIALILMCVLAMSQGTVSFSLTDLSSAFLRQGNPVYQTILWDLRIPRVIAGVLVGASLGMSGAILQGLLRNSLADSFVLGISSGAGLVAVLLLSVGGLQLWVPMGAWVGAMLASMLVYSIGLMGKVRTTERLILAGIAISAFLGSIQTLVLLFAEENRVQAVLNWLIGSLNGRGWEEVRLVGPYVVIAIALGIAFSRQLNVLNLGDEMATVMGMSVVRSQILLGAIASLLAASAVSMSGLTGFVGLVVPHGVRLLAGSDYRLILPYSALVGACVLVGADLLCRLGTIEFPVGAVTALLGSPIFVGLIYRRSRGTA